MNKESLAIRTSRRGLLVVAAALCCAIALPALAAPSQPKSTNFHYEYGKDVSAWYWERQQDQEVTTPVNIPPPAPPVSQRARLPSPQRPDTLPVAMNGGSPEKFSAVKFDLLERGVVENSEIRKMVVYIQEVAGGREIPSYRPETAKIQACRVTDFLSAGENEQTKDAPKFADTDCVEGTRTAPPAPGPGQTAAPPTWTFDLSKVAEPWGKNPFDNNGVMLYPIKQNLGPNETWQVNLKIPEREDPAAEGDQYENTKGRTVVELEFVPGKPTKLDVPDVPDVPAPDPGTTTTGGTTGTTGTTTGTTGGSPVVPSTDFGEEAIPGAAPAAAPAPVPGLVPAAGEEPRLPAYVWLALPLGLLALTAVRSVVLEPTGGPRPDGVIQAIRQRNAERRGVTGAPTKSSPARRRGGTMSKLTSGLRRLKK